VKLAKRQARAKRRAKTLRLVRNTNIPFYRSGHCYSGALPPAEFLAEKFAALQRGKVNFAKVRS
jgi:hypothetical protein